MIRRPPRSTLSSSSAASDVYKRQPVHLVRPGGRRPVDTPALAKVVVAPNPVGSAQLVGHRVAGRRGLPAGCRPLRPDVPVHLVRPGGRRPVDAPALAEVVVAPNPVGSAHLVGHRVACLLYTSPSPRD